MVMLGTDLAQLYGVETKALNRQVNRNLKRFPSDFMFKLTVKEMESLRCQIGTSSWGGHRYAPFAFTEQGVAMLSSVLGSDKAIQVNIAIMRAFVKLREIMLGNKELANQLHALERKVEGHDNNIQSLFDTIEKMTDGPIKRLPKIGFKK